MGFTVAKVGMHGKDNIYQVLLLHNSLKTEDLSFTQPHFAHGEYLIHRGALS